MAGLIHLLIALMLVSSVVCTDSFPHIFELSARPWLYQLGLKYHKHMMLEDVPDSEIKYYADRGITHIYLLGVWSIGAYGLNHDRTDAGLLADYKNILPDFTTADIIGSPFAVTKYTINPQIGTTSDLKNFRDRLNSFGMKLILDFVPNHSAIDAPTATSNIDLYVHNTPSQSAPFDRSIMTENGVYYGKDKYGYVWTDTAQFNYFNADTVKARTADLFAVAALADGIRCDMAMLAVNEIFSGIWGSTVSTRGYTQPSTEFWQTAIAAIKSRYPDTIFMAEQYWGMGDKLLSLGFDYVYDKEGLYDTLSGLSGGDESSYIWDIKNYVKNTLASGFLDHGAHFIANHDQDRAVYHWGVDWRADLAGMVTFTVPGLRFHWMGQWEGHRNKLDIHLRRQKTEAADEVCVSFYDMLLPILRDHKVFHAKDARIEYVEGSDNDAWKILALRMEHGSEGVLVAINLSKESASASIPLPHVSGAGNVTVKELVSGTAYSRDADTLRNQGLFVEVSSNYLQVFTYTV
ncbi:Alpha amylase, catalytic domain [Carpediemonas membranifera]|uniref:Alpha amylase, catalytic domain n=1 Tax=Carpediemonas membranifera TaxID=201153 RepID=A0A8J6E3G6_9EUKA|nr:Alpha amylase, catalytic domain [Carpediemonas membranifera]|eukprot:KAG9395591.1 Alpha amylase, catalytic domain [Carpediemonas membranifera]